MSVLSSPAALTAALNTDSCGLVDAALTACSLLIEPMLPLPSAGIIAQSAPTRAAVPAAEPADGVGLGVTLTGPAPPVGVAEVVVVLPHAAAASARPAASAAQAAGAVRKECSRMTVVLTQDVHVLAQCPGTVR